MAKFRIRAVLKLKKKRKVRNADSTKRHESGQNKQIPIGGALQRSADFYGFRPRRLKAICIDWPKAVVDFGICTQVNYVNDKHDGKVREYWHRFDKAPRVFFGDKPQKDGSEIIVIVGKFKIKNEGITG